MSTLTNIKKDFSPDKNWWELNPQMIIMSPFSKLYDRDKSKGKIKSSKTMWCVFFMSEPDEDINKFYRMPHEQRQQMLKDTYNEHFDWKERLTEECLDIYPHICLSAVEMSLKEEIDSMVIRAKFITRESQDLTLDKTEIVNGKAFTVRGNALQIENIRSKTPKLLENYEKIKEKFLTQKAAAKVKGQRRQTKAEKKLL